MANGCSKALFLDRDGVINSDTGYVYRPEDFEFTPGIFELCRAAQVSGYRLIVVTNQAGIARGHFSEADFWHLTDWMKQRFVENSIHIARVYYCPYHPEFGHGPYKRESRDRKPNPGMLLQAQSDFDLDLASSFLIGDKLSDFEAARAAGVGTPILLQSLYLPSSACSSYPVFESLDQIRRRFFATDQSISEQSRPGAVLPEPCNEKNHVRTQQNSIS